MALIAEVSQTSFNKRSMEESSSIIKIEMPDFMEVIDLFFDDVIFVLEMGNGNSSVKILPLSFSLSKVKAPSRSSVNFLEMVNPKP